MKPNVGEETVLPVPPTIPGHVLLALDGNGRWGTQRDLTRAMGHRATLQSFASIIEAAVRLEIRVLTLHLFSTENWHRSAEEVNDLMGLVLDNLPGVAGHMHALGVQFRHLGFSDGLDIAMRHALDDAVSLTRDNRRMIFNFGFNYGGRADIVQALRSLIASGTPPEQVNERTVGAALSTHGLPDPDLVIRTGGEQRLSNGPLWQVAYSELYFSPKLGPDFTGDDLREAIRAFGARRRTYGRMPTNTPIGGHEGC